MKYLALIYQNPIDLEDFNDAAYDELVARHVALQEKSKKAGKFVAADRLEDANTAKTLSTSNGQLLVSDGPYAETKEVLVGYYCFECDSIEQAIELASEIPRLRSTKVEVRPVFYHVE